VTIGYFILFIAFVELVALTVLIPLQLQMLTSAGADGAAWRLIPLSLSVPLGSYTAGLLMSRWGTVRKIQLAGTVLVPIGTLLLAFSNPAATLTMPLILALIGFGTGLQLPTS